MAVLARSSVLVLGFLAAAGSANQSRQRPPAQAPVPAGDEVAPEGRPMDSSLALGLWKSSFGAVKMEASQNDGLQGIWVYDRQGQEVIGYFDGAMDGNVFQFQWHEPAEPAPLRGSGYLVFDPNGNTFSGKWWTDKRDRTGSWNGWRTPDTAPRQGDGEAPADEAPSGPAEQAGPPPEGQYL